MKIFEPQLVLAREPDGEFTLHSVTITPNSCFSAGRAQRGVPPNVRLTAETESVLLQIRTRGGPCLQVLTAKPGIWPAVVTPIPVSYVERDPAIDYKTVLVRLPSGEAIALTVDEIH